MMNRLRNLGESQTGWTAFFVDHPLPPGIGGPDRKAARLPRKRPSNAAFGVVQYIYIYRYAVV